MLRCQAPGAFPFRPYSHRCITAVPLRGPSWAGWYYQQAVTTAAERRANSRVDMGAEKSGIWDPMAIGTVYMQKKGK